MSRHRDWDYDEDEYRNFKKPKKVEKDKLNKHRKAIYDMIEDDDDEEYFTDNRGYEFDEE
jgi:hypothetical protein